MSTMQKRSAMPNGLNHDEADVIAFESADAFESWLDDHLDLLHGVWLKIGKQSSGIASITSDEAVDSGLCYGWISGQRKSGDDVYYLQKYVPRRPRSRWSQINVAEVEQLRAAWRMRPSGQAEVDAAKADGRWSAAYESQRDATVPPDLAAALDANPLAASAFAKSNKTQQYGLILKLATARTAASRARQLDRGLATLLADAIGRTKDET